MNKNKGYGHSMTEGTRVIVYENPYTKTNEEGRAALKKKADGYVTHYDGHQFEYWYVQFDGDYPGDTYRRWVSSRDKIAPKKRASDRCKPLEKMFRM